MVAALDDNVAQRRRNKRVLYEGTYVKYPFENDLSALPKDAAYDCLIHFIKNDRQAAAPRELPRMDAPIRSVRHHERYLLPYNRKIWKLDPDPHRNRVGPTDSPAAHRGCRIIGARHRNRGVHPPASFLLSKREWNVSLPRAFEREAKKRQSLVLDYEVNTIRRTDRGWIVNGEREYKELVSTIRFVISSTHCPTFRVGSVEAALALRFNALRVVLFGVGRRGASTR